MRLTRFTKGILDFMFYAGMLVCLSLPFSLKLVGKLFPQYAVHYYLMLLLFFISGVLAVLIIGELRKMFSTVLREDCFVRGNVESLRKMGNYSFCITALSVIRFALAMTPATLVIILVFIVAGLFSKVLANVFDQAVAYKLENDFTI